MQAANAQLKSDLADLLRLPFAAVMLKEAAYFQTEFSSRDAAISSMRQELALRSERFPAGARMGDLSYEAEEAERHSIECAILAMEGASAELRAAFQKHLALG